MNVEFYFYYGCPWTYLAFNRLRETALRTGATIRWKPILVDLVEQLSSGENKGMAAKPAAGSAKGKYQAKDLVDWAAFCGVDIRHRGPFPLAAEWALRGGIVAAGADRAEPYSEAIFAAAFHELDDIGSLDVVTRCAQSVGLVDFAQDVRTGATLQAVQANSRELVARGGFGSPTIFVGDDMYFGNDRMPLVEFALSRSPELRFIAPGSHGQL